MESNECSGVDGTLDSRCCVDVGQRNRGSLVVSAASNRSMGATCISSSSNGVSDEDDTASPVSHAHANSRTIARTGCGS